MESPVPVSLFAYARPAHLRRTLEALRKNRVPLIYAFSDGPADKAEEEPVQKVRDILAEIDWCEVRSVYRACNLGLGSSIRAGITQTLQDHDRVIVVEDDIVLRPGAYAFAAAALKQYESAPRVMSVSLWNHRILMSGRTQGGYFSPRFCTWGWATYRHAWRKYVGSPAEIYDECCRRKIDIAKWGSDLKWQIDQSAERNLWSAGFVLTHLLHDKVSYFAPEPLAINMGNDGSGMNDAARKFKEDVTLSDKPVELPAAWPPVVIPLGLDKQIARYVKIERVGKRRRLRNVASRVKRMCRRVFELSAK